MWVAAARRGVDKRQRAYGQEACRVEGEERDGGVALVGPEEPDAPRAVETQRDLDQPAPRARVCVGFAAPGPAGRTDAELRGAREFEILPPERIEHGHARAPRHPD